MPAGGAIWQHAYVVVSLWWPTSTAGCFGPFNSTIIENQRQALSWVFGHQVAQGDSDSDSPLEAAIVFSPGAHVHPPTVTEGRIFGEGGVGNIEVPTETMHRTCTHTKQVGRMMLAGLQGS